VYASGAGGGSNADGYTVQKKTGWPRWARYASDRSTIVSTVYVEATVFGASLLAETRRSARTGSVGSAMRAVWYDHQGLAGEVLQVGDLSEPEPQSEADLRFHGVRQSRSGQSLLATANQRL
jgi:hypothetical protein